MHVSDESVTRFHHSFPDALMYMWESQRIQKELELQLDSYFKSYYAHILLSQMVQTVL